MATMDQNVTLTLPQDLLSAAEQQARRDARPVEAVLLDWLSQGADLPVASLSDARVLELTRLALNDDEQHRLSELLGQQREDSLTSDGASELGRLMNTYRHGLVRKAEAHKVAVERGLVTPLG